MATAIWDKALKETEELDRTSAPELRELYSGLISAVRKEAARAASKALPADAIAKAVEHAVTARRPKTRYVIGGDARFWLLLNLLPDSMRDRLILSGLNK